ncbi:MAG: hypothetical protein WBQ95_19425 [Terracidiphilus sp.]
MGDMEMMLSPDEVNSIVLDAAESAAGRNGLTISAAALDKLVHKGLPALNRANESGELARRREEVARNTAALIERIHQVQMAGQPGEISGTHMAQGLFDLCRYFPDFFPFCP